MNGSLSELVDPASVGNALPWSRTVTFTVTHDIPNNDGFFVFARGECAIVAINTTSQWASPEIPTWSLQWGGYRCRIHKYLMQVQGDKFRFAIAPREVQMWLREG